MITNYAIWGAILLLQNFSFTMVSRARNSASLVRHINASLMSNGVWMASMMYMIGPMLDNLQGKNGILVQVLAGAFYTVFTVTGSVLAHKYALVTEKGKGAVGANDKYKQVTNEEWNGLVDSVVILRHRLIEETRRGTPDYKPNGLGEWNATFETGKFK